MNKDFESSPKIAENGKNAQVSESAEQKCQSNPRNETGSQNSPPVEQDLRSEEGPSNGIRRPNRYSTRASHRSLPPNMPVHSPVRMDSAGPAKKRKVFDESENVDEARSSASLVGQLESDAEISEKSAENQAEANCSAETPRHGKIPLRKYLETPEQAGGPVANALQNNPETFKEKYVILPGLVIPSPVIEQTETSTVLNDSSRVRDPSPTSAEPYGNAVLDFRTPPRSAARNSPIQSSQHLENPPNPGYTDEELEIWKRVQAIIDRNAGYEEEEEARSPSVRSSPPPTPEPIARIKAAEVVGDGFVINIKTGVIAGRRHLALAIKTDFMDCGHIEVDDNFFVIGGEMKSERFTIQSDKSCKIHYENVDLDLQREEMVELAKQKLEQDTEMFFDVPVPKRLHTALLAQSIDQAFEEHVERLRIQEEARRGYVPARPPLRRVSRSPLRRASRSRSPRMRPIASKSPPHRQIVAATHNAPAPPIVPPSPNPPAIQRVRAVATRRGRQAAPIAPPPSNPPTTRTTRARAAAANAAQAAAIPPANPPRRVLKRIADDARQARLPNCDVDEARFAYQTVDDIRAVLENISRTLKSHDYGYQALDLDDRQTKLVRAANSYDKAPTARKLENLFNATVLLCSAIGLKAN